MALSDSLLAAINGAPDLSASPSLALAAAQTPAPTVAAQSVSLATQVDAANQAAVIHHPSVLHDIGSFFGRDIVHPAAKALNVLSAPLREVQHQFRYLHDVYSEHGVADGILETLGVGAGALGGGLLGGPEGAVLGGEAAAGILGRTTFRDSWQKTANGEQYRDPNHPDWGQISIGRDIAHILGMHPSAHGAASPFTFTSGALDAIGDMLADPVAVAGKLNAARMGAGVGGALAERFPGTTISTADDIERAYATNGAVRRAVGEIAQSDPATISQAFPKLQSTAPGFLSALGSASTPNEVMDVLRDATATGQLLSSRMPSVPITRVPFRSLTEAANQSELLSKISRPFTLLPTAYDPEMGRLGKTFSLGDDLGAQGIYRTVQMSQSDTVAREVTNAYLNTVDEGQRLDIYKNAVKAAIVARSGIKDADTVQGTLQHADEYIAELVGGAKPSVNGIMGVGMDGKSLGSRAILDNQTGRLAFPDYTGFKRVAQELEGSKHLLGSVDDFAYQHVTQGFFKPLALATLGFAERIAASEMIPNVLRNGVLSTVGAAMLGNLSDTGYKLGEVKALQEAADALEAGGTDASELWDKAQQTEPGIIARNIYKLADRAGITNSDDYQRLLKLQQTLGLRTSRGISATDHIDAEFNGPAEAAHWDLRSARLQVPQKMRYGDDFSLYGNENANYAYHWHNALTETADDAKSQAAAKAYLQAIREGKTPPDAFGAGAKAATDWLESQPEAKLTNYWRHFNTSDTGTELALTPHQDWGRVAMENVRGLTHSGDGTPNIELLAGLANGTVPNRAVLDQIAPVDRPLMIKGRQFLPVTAPNPLKRITNAGFQKVLDPYLNYFSRDPIYAQAYLTEIKKLEPAVNAGLIEEPAAIARAADRATLSVLPFIHNTLERSQFDTTARNFMPFLFAQTQAYKRAGRLLLDDPGAFRRYQLAMTALVGIGQHTKDENGNPYLMYPGSGWIDSHVIGALNAIGAPVIGSAPFAFSGNSQSLQTVFPFTEDPTPWHKIGPVIGVPIHLAEMAFPKIIPSATSIFGSQETQSGILGQLIPNTPLRHAFTAAFQGTDSTREIASASVQTLQAMQYHDNQNPKVKAWFAARDAGQDPGAYPGLVPPPGSDPEVMQTFISRLNNQTRINVLLRAIAAAVLPASPQPQIGDIGVKGQFAALVQKEGIHQASIDFIKQNPDATPYTVFSSGTAAGEPVPATQIAEDFINANGALINKYPYAAAWLVPQGGAYDAAIYNEQIAQGFRVRKTPKEFLNSLYVAEGNHDYYDQALPAYKSALASGNYDPSSLRQQFTAWQTQYGMQHPVWWADFGSATRTETRKIAAQQIDDLLASGAAPKGEQTTKLAGLAEDYHAYLNAKLAQVDTAANLKASWQSYIDNVVASDPMLAPVARSVYRDL